MEEFKPTLLSNINNIISQRGHQLKEFRNIPNKWNLVKTQDVFSLEYGKGLIEDKRDGGEFPVVGSAGIVGYHSKSIVKGAGIVVGRKGSAGLAVYIEDDFWAIDTTYYVKPKIDVNMKWLFSIIDYMKWSRLCEGTVPGLNRNDAYQLYFPLPSLTEQNKIAEILFTLDDAIENSDAIIKETQQLKKGLMEKFFRNKAFFSMKLAKSEKTELMPIYLKNLGKIITGTTPSTIVEEYYNANDYMFIGPADLGLIKYIDKSDKYISEKGFRVSRQLPQNTVMVVCIGATIGKVGITSKPCATNQQINSIIPKKEFPADYVYYLMRGIKKYLLAFSGNTATPILNKGEFGKVVSFVHKSVEERKKIGDILSEVDYKLENEQNYKSELEQLKKGLSQILLTGKVRVKG